MMETILRICTVGLFILTSVNWINANDGRQGNMEPLGKQRPSEGHIQTLSTVPAGDEFFDKYLLPGRPVVFKGAAKEIPAYKLWTDEYLKATFGSVVAVAEEGKKENRSLRTFQFSVEDFVNRYKTEDIYMVHSLPKEMRADIALLPCISCGGFTNVLQDVVLWFSSGGTKSVLHSDGVDNINCLFSGTKDLYMVDKKYESKAHIDVQEGGYSSVDVDAVNLTKYPNFAKLPWYEVHMEAGDCLFIPFRWLHQVRSYGRNIAVNVWFNHIKRIDPQDCYKSEKRNKYLTMTNVDVKPLDGARNALLIELEARKDKVLKKKDLSEFFSGVGTELTRKHLKMIWPIFDKNEDKHISREELVQMTVDDLQAVNRMMPMYNLDGEDEDENEGLEADPTPYDGKGEMDEDLHKNKDPVDERGIGAEKDEL